VGNGYYAQLRIILLAHGCEFVRQGKGSHEVWQSPINGKRFPVPVTVVARPMANTVLKQAGIKQRF
jgi:predicted RNA binding protein YcfA (HicA-like mRNA interferase family)